MARADILRVALSLLDVREDAGHNRDRAGKIKAMIDSVEDWREKVDIGPDGFLLGHEWCAAFVSYVYKMAGHPLKHQHGGRDCTGFYGCGRFIEWLGGQGAWYDYKHYHPNSGDPIFIDWGAYVFEEGKDNPQVALDEEGELSHIFAMKIVDHTGLCYKVIEEGEVFEGITYKESGLITIEGNVGSGATAGVKKCWRPDSRCNVIGFGTLID